MLTPEDNKRIQRLADSLGVGSTTNRDGEEISFVDWNAACDEYLAMEGVTDPYNAQQDIALSLHEAACQYADAKFNIGD